MRPLKIAVFVSGGGTNLQALLDAEKAGKLSHGHIELVIANRAGAYALVRADQSGVRHLTVLAKDFADTKAYEQELQKILRDYEIDLIVLAGFLRILSKDFVAAYKDRIINIHPSLIPSFCGDGCYGLKVHEQALKRGVKVTGATVHLVNEITDGGTILCQKAVSVKAGDTPQILQKRVMTEAEWIILPETVEKYCQYLQRQGNE